MTLHHWQVLAILAIAIAWWLFRSIVRGWWGRKCKDCTFQQRMVKLIDADKEALKARGR